VTIAVAQDFIMETYVFLLLCTALVSKVVFLSFYSRFLTLTLSGQCYCQADTDEAVTL